jgi:hypothetical protein
LSLKISASLWFCVLGSEYFGGEELEAIVSSRIFIISCVRSSRKLRNEGDDDALSRPDLQRIESHRFPVNKKQNNFIILKCVELTPTGEL